MNAINTPAIGQMPADHATKKMGLFPTMESLQSVIDLGNSQLPIMDKNVLYGLFMTYHNTLLKQVEACRG
jgi:hypothetical protein